MALLSALVRVIAEVQGMEESYVSGVARYLREAGYISQAGRGRGAAHANVRDAANILIAVSAAERAKDAVETVKLFRNLRTWRAAYGSRCHLLPALSEEGLLFGDALETLLGWSAPNSEGLNELQTVLDHVRQESSHEDKKSFKSIPKPELNLTFTIPEANVVIRILSPEAIDLTQQDQERFRVHDKIYISSESFSASFTYDFETHEVPPSKEGWTDRSVQVTFSQKTLLRVAETLNS